MKRILIIGSNGAGKSTFSYKLSSKLNLPLIHIDQIYWEDNWKRKNREEFEKEVLIEAMKEKWIIEGNNIKSLATRLQYADVVFWFEFPSLLCIGNVIKREIKYFKQVRPDMPKGCVSKLNFKFLKDVWYFNKKNHEKIEMMLANEHNIKVIRFTNYKEVNGYLKTL